MDRGIGSWLAKRAFHDGDREALAFGDERFTYGELEARACRLASALFDLGVRRGDRVALLLVNGYEFVEATFAAAKLGAIAVPVNTRLAAAEVGFILADAGADTFLRSGALAEVGHRAVAEPGTRVRHVVVVRGEPGAGESAYEDLLDAGSADPLDFDVDPRDVHGLMYTSGTTGRPKGVMLTHANTIANAVNNLQAGRGLSKYDVTVTAAPMFHIGGLGVHTLPLIFVGGRNVVHAAFDPKAVLAAMADERVTVQFLVPAMWAALMAVPDFDDYDLSALVLAVSGGAPTPLTVIEFFRSRGVPFQEGFGMTETAPTVSILDAERVTEKAGSIGRPVFDVETRIVDDDDRDRPPNVVGELLVRGENVFAGYWNQPAATAAAFRGGWFHTGDLGRVDEEGFITLVDRKKDMVITGGENVYPIEVEQVLYRHPAVAEAAVIGVPDEKWGESLKAVVAFKPGERADAEELIAFVRERLAHFKAPRTVEVVEALPRNATGKVLKTELRRRYTGSEGQAVTR